MNLKKRSLIWTIPRIELIEIVTKSNSISEILKHFNLENKGGNYKTLKARLKFEEIDYSQIPKNNLGRKFPQFALSLEVCLTNVFIENSIRSSNSVKRYLVKYNLIPYCCAKCSLVNIWNKERLCLQLDHINGINIDNRLENLRWLCPNCHSQTNTFCGRKNKKIKKSEINPNWRSLPRLAGRKIKNRPSKGILFTEIESMGYCAVGKKYGVSDNTIRKWIK